MPKKMKKRKPKEQPTLFLTICADCKIRLGVRKEKTDKCDLCKSPNISVSAWKW